MLTSEYTDLLIDEHRDQPRYKATVALSVEPLCEMMSICEMLKGPALDLDTAVGRELDILGEWIGLARQVPFPMNSFYFTWNQTGSGEDVSVPEEPATAATGWDEGKWFGIGDTMSGVQDLDDSEYRLLLRMKALANRWDGSAEGLYAILGTLKDRAVFIVEEIPGELAVKVTIRPGSETKLTNVEKLLVKSGIIPLKPVGISIQYVFEEA